MNVTRNAPGFTPNHLGKQTNAPTDTLDAIPWTGGPVVVHLDCSEFTSHCPVTGQPDFGSLVIEYEPDGHLVETKSMKLFLWQYRHASAFNEAITDEIAEAFMRQIRPRRVMVTGRFNSRGGIAVTVTARR